MQQICYKKTILCLLAAVFLSALLLIPKYQAESALSEGKMKDFIVVVPGVLSRSGLPSGKDLADLRNKWCRSVITLISSEEISAYKKIDPTQTLEFKNSGLRKIQIIIPESSPPTNAQAYQFLNIVTNPANQPVHIYCRKGHARTGTMIALYRYSIQGWNMDKAIKEGKRYGSGINWRQRAWLKEWSVTHDPGKY